MERTEIKGDFTPDPSVQLSNKEGKPGTFLIGTIAKPARLVEKVGKFKKDKHVYSFILKDTNASVQILKDEQYVEAPVKEGDLVILWASDPLHRKLSKLAVGEMVEIQYHGKSLNPETGNTSHMFRVFKLGA